MFGLNGRLYVLQKKSACSKFFKSIFNSIHFGQAEGTRGLLEGIRAVLAPHIAHFPVFRGITVPPL
jgi:hypothetical protein